MCMRMLVFVFVYGFCPLLLLPRSTQKWALIQPSSLSLSLILYRDWSISLCVSVCVASSGINLDEVKVEPIWLQPTFVYSKVPRKLRSLYTEAAVCAAIGCAGMSDADTKARREMGMNPRGKPGNRVTAASVLAATKALGSKVPKLRKELSAVAEAANQAAPKERKKAAPRASGSKRKRASKGTVVGLEAETVGSIFGNNLISCLQWCGSAARMTRQLEWMEVPGTVHVACPVCKASHVKSTPPEKRKHMRGCPLGIVCGNVGCIGGMPLALANLVVHVENTQGPAAVVPPPQQPRYSRQDNSSYGTSGAGSGTGGRGSSYPPHAPHSHHLPPRPSSAGAGSGGGGGSSGSGNFDDFGFSSVGGYAHHQPYGGGGGGGANGTSGNGA